jgi:hypothetical protein
VKVGLAPEGLPDLQRAYLGLGLVFVVAALLAGSLSELVLMDHDCFLDIIDIDTMDKSIRNSFLSIQTFVMRIYPDK